MKLPSCAPNGLTNAGLLEQAITILFIKLVTDGVCCLLSSSNKTNIPSVLRSNRSIKNTIPQFIIYIT